MSKAEQNCFICQLGSPILKRFGFFYKLTGIISICEFQFHSAQIMNLGGPQRHNSRVLILFNHLV